MNHAKPRSMPTRQRVTGYGLRVAIFLLLTPPLLAPVRYQSGDETIMLNPAQGPSKAAFALPSANALSSPTVIAVSPTLLSPTALVTPSAVTSSTPSPTTSAAAKTAPSPLPPPGNGSRVTDYEMSEVTALMCTNALKAVIDISLLSYQQKQQSAVAKITMAATIAGTEAEARHYPNLTALNTAESNLSFGTAQKRELQAALTNVRTICANPNPAPLTPGSRIPIERPN